MELLFNIVIAISIINNKQNIIIIYFYYSYSKSRSYYNEIQSTNKTEHMV